jgi:hypothetical protein
MWKNMVEQDRPQMATYYSTEKMRFACWITKARIQTTVSTPHLSYKNQSVYVLEANESCLF